MSRLAGENAVDQTFVQADTGMTAQRGKKRSQKLQYPGRTQYRESLRVTQVEHMSEVDCFDGEKMRSHTTDEEDLVNIHPVLDGRFKDIGRP